MRGRSGWKADAGAACVQTEEGAVVLLEATPGPLSVDDSTVPLPSICELLLLLSLGSSQASGLLTVPPGVSHAAFSRSQPCPRSKPHLFVSS